MAYISFHHISYLFWFFEVVAIQNFLVNGSWPWPGCVVRNCKVPLFWAQNGCCVSRPKKSELICVLGSWVATNLRLVEQIHVFPAATSCFLCHPNDSRNALFDLCFRSNTVGKHLFGIQEKTRTRASILGTLPDVWEDMFAQREFFICPPKHPLAGMIICYIVVTYPRFVLRASIRKYYLKQKYHVRSKTKETLTYSDAS